MMETKQLIQKITEIVKRSREESVRCAEDHVPVNLALDYVVEDMADFLEKSPDYPTFNRREFLLACGFASW